MNTMNFKKREIKKVLSVLVLFLGIIGLNACSSKSNTDANPYVKLVKTQKVVKISTIKQKQFPGIVEEVEQVNLAFRVAGPIHNIYVTEGQYVKKGQVIAEIDRRDYEVQKNTIKAQVIQLQAEYKRIEELKKRKSIAENDYEKMKAGKEMAELKLQNATDQLNDTKLHAPFSGYITDVMFEKGEMVNSGTPIASLVDISTLKVEVNIPASLYIIKDKITQIEFTQEDLPGEYFPVTLRSSNIKANNNGLYKLYLLHTPSANSKIAPGMNVSVNIEYNTQNNELLSIPIHAIFEKETQSCVWIVENDKVQLRKITTNSLVNNGNIGITTGLKMGDVVVIGGLNLLHENELVQVVKPHSTTNVGNIL